MIVTGISTRKFAKHKAVDVTLPRTGLVLVTGKNGEGKSTLSEAVAQGVWNEPIRGKPGWRTGEKSGVRIDFEGGHVQRNVSSKHVLTWQVGDDGAGDFPTRSKSQAELESHIGTYHVWRHACVFHTKDASVFTEASDAERKRLLEDVLELSRVEKAYRRSLTEVNEARRQLCDAEYALGLKTAELAGLEAQVALLRGELEPVADLEAMRSEGRELKAKLDAARLVRSACDTTETDTRIHEQMLRAKLAAAQDRMEKFAAMQGTCSECEQSIDGVHRDRQVALAEASREALRYDIAQAEKAAKEAASEASKADEAVRDLDGRYQTNVAAGREAVAAKKRNEERGEKLKTLEEQVAKLRAAEAGQTTTVANARKELSELEAASVVLSYQGVRAAMLDAAVRSLQDLANDWLSRLGLQHLEVLLSSQSETKSGSVSDKISFEVKGAGGGHGYLAASTGEQRRIDIAMLLALGELAADARGMSSESTMFVDELFDGLDEDGVGAVVSMLRELSTQRCVVVITHSQRLVTSLAPDLHLVADDGKITGK